MHLIRFAYAMPRHATCRHIAIEATLAIRHDTLSRHWPHTMPPAIYLRGQLRYAIEIIYAIERRRQPLS